MIERGNHLKAAKLISWHDGVLLGIDICFDDGVFLKISAMIYETDESRHRTAVDLKFFGIKNLSLSCNILEIIDNSISGNISNGYIKSHKKRNFFCCYLIDGFATFDFDRVRVSWMDRSDTPHQSLPPELPSNTT